MSAAVHQSTNNPFRTQLATTNSTGASAVSSTPSSPPPSFTSTLYSHPTTNSSRTSSNTHAQTNPRSNSASTPTPQTEPVLESTALIEEPPAYTFTADVDHGETTLEYGTRRPFQPTTQPTTPRPIPPSTRAPLLSPQPTPQVQHPQQSQSLWQQITGQLRAELNEVSSALLGPQRNDYPQESGSGRSSSSYPGQGGPLQPEHRSPQHTPAPPLPPRPRPSASISSSAPSSTHVSSEFALDFYAAGSVPDLALDDSSPTSAAGPTPASSSPRGRHLLSTNSSLGYRPPAGPPPSSRARTTSPSPNIPDDGRPTKTPMPGHPLLKDGNLLVYPAGYECHKCHNTGYKQNDPSSPCRKCWSKYAKPFSGALVYTPWTSSASTPTSSGSNRNTFQRPLPSFRPPIQPQVQTRPQTLRRPQCSSFAPAPTPQIQITSPYAPSPQSNGRFFPPGDPRRGGRLCWRCYGRGYVRILLFEDMCEVCGGVGRVFR